MSQNPQFMFDVGSPNAFLSHEAIPAIERRIGVKFDYVPVLLGGIFKATNVLLGEQSSEISDIGRIRGGKPQVHVRRA